MKFLLQYYSKENIDLSSVEVLATSDERNEKVETQSRTAAVVDKYSMIEISEEPSHNTGFIWSIISLVQRFPFYFIILIIILIFLRRRYCKGKRKRYTL